MKQKGKRKKYSNAVLLFIAVWDDLFGITTNDKKNYDD